MLDESPPQQRRVDAAYDGMGDNEGSPEMVSPIEIIRGTPEYLVAWDMELWKQVETQKFQKQQKERERRAEEELRTRLAIRETEAAKIRDRKLHDLQLKEDKLNQAMQAVERKKQKLVDVERQLKHRNDEITEHRKRVDEDAESRIRRAQDDAAHKMELMRKQLKETEGELGRLHERLEHGQKEYLHLWEEFSAFKLREVTGSMSGAGAVSGVVSSGGGGGGDDGAEGGARLITTVRGGPDTSLGNPFHELLQVSVNAEIARIVERGERRMQCVVDEHKKEVSELQGKVVKMQRSAQHYKNENQRAEERLKHVEGLRGQLERQVELLQYKLVETERQLTNSKNNSTPTRVSQDIVASPSSNSRYHQSHSSHQSQGPRGGGDQQKRTVSAGVDKPAVPVRTELQRLVAQRQQLLDTGVYAPSSPLIMELDRSIIKARRHAAATEAMESTAHPVEAAA